MSVAFRISASPASYACHGVTQPHSVHRDFQTFSDVVRVYAVVGKVDSRQDSDSALAKRVYSRSKKAQTCHLRLKVVEMKAQMARGVEQGRQALTISTWSSHWPQFLAKIRAQAIHAHPEKQWVHPQIPEV